jgi:hypothetical protein
MNALNIGLTNSGFSTPGQGACPWGLVDFESGVYSAPTRIQVKNPKSPSMTWDLGMVLSKDNGTTHWTLRVGDAAQGALTLVTDTGLPPGGYNPLRQEGGLSLGEGGDGSAAGIGAFFEGVVIANFTTDATDNAIQANLNSVYGR